MAVCLGRGGVCLWGCLPGGCVCLGGLLAGCLPKGDVCQGGCLPCEGVYPLLWTEFLTRACENITFPQLQLRTVTKIKKLYLLSVVHRDDGLLQLNVVSESYTIMALGTHTRSFCVPAICEYKKSKFFCIWFGYYP